MKTTKFNLDFKDLESKHYVKLQAAKCGLTINEYILESIKIGGFAVTKDRLCDKAYSINNEEPKTDKEEDDNFKPYPKDKSLK